MKNIDTRCIVLVLLLITSCTTPPKKHLDETLQEAQKPWQGIRWWQAFHDPLLNKFAHQIIAQNLDIQVAAARLTAARAVSTQVISGLYPDISFASLESRVKNRFFLNQPTYGLNGLIVNWELDVFGQVRAGIRAANARIGVAAVNVDDMRNLVVADLTKAVIDWRQAQQTVKFTESLLKAEDEQIRLFDYRTKAGLIDASFLERARAERAQILAQLPEAKASANDAEHQIERLLGDTDHQVTTALVQASPMSLNIPAPNKTLAITIDIIQNRPDVRKARFDLLAAQADLDQAEANLWPKISILSFFGVENGSSTARLAAGNPVWAIASLVTAPILNFGRLRGAIDEKNAEAKAMELTYENTILLALQETKTALSDYLNGLNAVQTQAHAVKLRQSTVAIAKERFQRGLTDMSDLTTAQTELVQAILTLINQKTSTARAYIRLQKALGQSYYDPQNTKTYCAFGLIQKKIQVC